MGRVMPAKNNNQHSVLFVCLGNICRSPSAEAVFRSQVEKEGLENNIIIDSCGTASYHIGEHPDERSVVAAQKRGYNMAKLVARQLDASDFLKFDYILAMDEENLNRINEIKPVNSKSTTGLFLDFHPDKNVSEVPDPYYGGAQGFGHVLDLIETASEHLLLHLKKSI